MSDLYSIQVQVSTLSLLPISAVLPLVKYFPVVVLTIQVFLYQADSSLSSLLLLHETGKNFQCAEDTVGQWVGIQVDMCEGY